MLGGLKSLFSSEVAVTGSAIKPYSPGLTMQKVWLWPMDSLTWFDYGEGLLVTNGFIHLVWLWRRPACDQWIHSPGFTVEKACFWPMDSLTWFYGGEGLLLTNGFTHLVWLWRGLLMTNGFTHLVWLWRRPACDQTCRTELPSWSSVWVPTELAWDSGWGTATGGGEENQEMGVLNLSYFNLFSIIFLLSVSECQ